MLGTIKMNIFFKKLNILVVTFTVFCSFLFPKTALALSKTPQETKTAVTEIEYLLLSHLSYCDLSECSGLSVDKIAENEDILKDAKRLYLKNPTGKANTSNILKKYLSGWILDEVFANKESGFFACAFKNAEKKQIVLSFRGTTDALGKDGMNDAEFGLISVDAPQISDALKLTEKYINDHAEYEFSSTGHSLGGALATEIAQYYGWRAETFNAAQMTGTLYYDNAEIFGKIYHGFDLWKTLDHVNQHDLIVGTYEYGLFKNAVKHKNKSTGNSFFAHSINHMITIDSASNSISLSDTTDESYLSNLKNQLRIANSNGAVLLGNTKADFLTAQRMHGEFDVIYGGDGNDFLDSGDSNDTLIGSAGNDLLDGGANNDTYLYYEGDGLDTILDSGGHDKIVVYSDKEITTDEDENSIFIYLENELIARLDKTARTDSYSGKPNGAKISEKYFTFTVEQKRGDGSVMNFEIKSKEPSPILPVYKIAYSGNLEIKISDSKVSSYDFSDQDGRSVRCFYTKDEKINTNVTGEINPLDIIISKANENDTVNIHSLDEPVSLNGKITIAINSSKPEILSNGESTVFSEIPYSDSLYIRLNRNMLITTENRKFSIKAAVLNKETDGGGIEWNSTDTDVAEVDGNGNTVAKRTGTATITAELNGHSALCRIYVISNLYAAIILIALLLVICLTVLLAVSLIKHIIKKIKKNIIKHSEEKAAI